MVDNKTVLMTRMELSCVALNMMGRFNLCEVILDKMCIGPRGHECASQVPIMMCSEPSVYDVHYKGHKLKLQIVLGAMIAEQKQIV